MRARIFLPCASLLFALASPALAQDAQAQGRALFNEGVALFNKGDFDSACPKLEASLKAFPGIGTRGKLAECYEKQGKYASAWSQWKEVAQLSNKSGETAREQIATARVKGLEPKLSYVTLTLAPGSDTPGLVVKRGGVEVDRSRLGTPEAIDSGAVTVEVSAPGKKTFATQLTVGQGQTAKLDLPPLAPAVATVIAPPSVSSGPPDPAINVTTDTTTHGDAPAWQKPTGLVMLGVGVVGVGIGAALGLSAKSKYDSAFDNGSCDHTTNQCDAAGQSAVDSAHSQATISTILFAAGGALAVGGLVVFLTAPSSHARALTVSPMMTAGGGFVSVNGAL